MNIVIVTGMFPPIRTGTSFFSKNLAETFVRQGHKVSVVTVKNDLVVMDDYPFEVKRIPAVFVPLKNFFKHLRFCSFSLNNYIKINNIVKKFKPDIILLINHYLDIAFPAIYAARKNSLPLVVSVGTQLQSNRKIRNKLLRILDRTIVGNLIFPFAKKIISWDKEIERYINETHTVRNSRKSYIIPYGVNGEPGIYERHIHDYDKIDQIVGIGAVIDQRNYLHAVKVFSEVLKYYPNMVFKIIGHEYIDKPRLLAKNLGIENNVVFMGEISNNEIIDEIGKSFFGINIATGYYAGLGTASIEIMLMGVPLVAKVPEDLFGSDARLKDMENIIYTNGVDVQDTVSKIVKVIDNKPLRMKIGQMGKQFVQEFMNWDFVSQKYIELFNNVINEKK